MKKFLLFFVFLFAIASVMAQNRVMDTLTFYRGGKIYKVRLYSDHVTINDTSYYGFPGFGTDHSHSAYGDHAHSGYEPSISEGRTDQYWRGDKHWQTFPIAITKDSVPWIHTPGNKTVLRNPYDTVITSTIYADRIYGKYGQVLTMLNQYDATSTAALVFDPSLGFSLYSILQGKTNYLGNVPADDHGIMISNSTPTEETRYIFDSAGIHFVDWGPHHTHLKNFGNASDRWKLYGKDVDLKGNLYVHDSSGTTRTTLEAGYGNFMARVLDIPNDFMGGLIVDQSFGTALYNDTNYAGFINSINSDNHFVGYGSMNETSRICLGSNYQRWDTTYSVVFNVDPSGYLGFKNRVNPAWWREGLDFGRVDGLSLFSQHGVSATDLAGIDLTSDAIDFSYGDRGAYTTLRYKNLWAGYDLPELGKSSIHTITLAPWSSNGILGDPDSEEWWDWIYSRNLTINDSVYLNNLNTGTSSDSIIVGEAKTNFGSVFTQGRTGKTTLIKKVKNTLSDGVYAYSWINSNSSNLLHTSALSAGNYSISVTYANNSGNAATVTNGLYTTDRITTTGTSATKIMSQGAVKTYGDSIALLKVAKGDSAVNKGYAAYYWSTVQFGLKANLATPTFTGTVTLPSAWKIETTAVTTTGTKLNYLTSATGTTGTTSTNLVFSTSPTFITPTLGVATGTNYISNVATGTQPYACTSTTANTNLNADMVDGKHSTDIKLNSEVIPLFGVGVDSTMMSTNLKFPIGYSQGIVLDSLAFITTTTATGGTVNITSKIRYGTSIADTGTAVIYAGTSTTSRTTVTKAYTFTNATIAKGNMIWLVFSAITTKPRNLMVQLIGHKL